VILVASSRIMKRKILSENQMHLIAKATRFDNFSAQGENIKSFATVICTQASQATRPVSNLGARFWISTRESPQDCRV
jgi:hypothetical protein